MLIMCSFLYTGKTDNFVEGPQLLAKFQSLKLSADLFVKFRPMFMVAYPVCDLIELLYTNSKGCGQDSLVNGLKQRAFMDEYTCKKLMLDRPLALFCLCIIVWSFSCYGTVGQQLLCGNPYYREIPAEYSTSTTPAAPA